MAEDTEWVLESVLAFLGCPAWTVPVSGFIERQCSVFDDEEENKLSYTEIHNEYKILVEKLIHEHLNDMGISEEQFQQACLSPLANSPDVKMILQSVVAVEDFAVFKEMMLQKNIELQLQAIQIIQQNNGDLPECLKNGADFISDLEQQEIKMISEALRISKEEYEQEQLRRKEKSEANVHKNFPKTSSQEKVTTPAREQVKPLQTIKPSLKEEELPYRQLSARLKELSSTEAAEAWMEQARKEAGIQGALTSLSQAEKEQLQERAEYLRQKRAELLARKGESKKGTQNTEQSKENASSPNQQQKQMTEEELKNLQKRKQLAEKLKEEVIHK
ncbi:cilia- and flagella-associated protein 36 isoform X1 [Bufo gargarizans]|uniref:cilia- and flagella-associated protein 36 isoform X1 n=1 Tax=Bufo gargarizans TaxID=30331 RepID=UPI001CF4E7C1|nr:cilia- and flagella-associated protein 36 isoform X1 [Bufo gargarizans]